MQDIAAGHIDSQSALPTEESLPQPHIVRFLLVGPLAVGKVDLLRSGNPPTII